MPGSGSSTIFLALTQRGSGSAEAAQAVVAVPDERVDTLGGLSGSKKLVYAQLKFVEASGMVRRGSRGAAGALSAELLGHLRECDALLLVVRGFDGADPAPQIDELSLELTVADHGVVDGRVERARKEAQSGDAAAKRSLVTLERASEELSAGRALRDIDWDDEERRALAGFAPLTLKPAIVVVNAADEGGDGPPGALAVPGRLEAEVAGMEAADAAELLASYGHGERAIGRVIRAVYDRLALITFLTTGPKESRAWEVRSGAAAPEAAGAIHSDMERGFIRAEVCSFEAVVEAGGWPEARGKGLVRQEGKSYQIQEGDVVEFRFAV